MLSPKCKKAGRKAFRATKALKNLDSMASISARLVREESYAIVWTFKDPGASELLYLFTP